MTMTYDPSVTALLIVGVIFAVTVFLNISSDWEVAGELARATDRWTAPLVIRRYRNDPTTRRRLWAESGVFRRHGYRPQLHRSRNDDAALSREVAVDVNGALAGLPADEEILVAFFRA